MSWLITGAFKNKLLLDEYAGAAAAYSLRNLTITNDAPVVRVRRSSDNTEQDFTAAQVTNGTLTTFCGAGNGFVRTWYDQSGNGNHAIQATTGSQPQIVSSGALITLGSKASIRFNTHFLEAPDSASLRPSNVSMFGVFATTSIGANQVLVAKNFGGVYTASYAFAFIASKNRPSVDNAVERTVSSPSNLASNTAYLLYMSYDQSTLRGGHNGSAEYTTSTSGSLQYSTLGFRIGMLGNNVFPLLGSMQEIIVFSASQTANRTAIESNINTNYVIY
jgi:hypothetical protein